MDCPAEFQVAAQTDGKIAKATFQGTDGQEVGQGLGRMLMPAVTGVDNGNGGPAGSYHGRALFRMTHGADVRIAGDDPDGVGYAFAFGGGRGAGVGEAQYLSAQVQHGSLEAEPRAGAWLVETGGQFPAFACVGIFGGIGFDVIRQVKKSVEFFHGKIQWIH